MTKDEALKLALEALQHMCHTTRAKTGYKPQLVEAAMASIEEALDQVGKIHDN